MKKQQTLNQSTLRPWIATVCIWMLLLGIAPSAAALETSDDDTTEAIAATENMSAETDAAESTSEAADEGDDTSNKGDSENLLEFLRSEIAVYMETYQLTVDMPDQALANAYYALDSTESKAAWDRANELLSLAKELSTEDADVLISDNNTKLCLRFYNVMKQIVESVPMVADVTVNGSLPTGLAASADTTFEWTVSASQISVTATPKSTTSGCSTSYSAQSSTLKLTSSSEAKLTVSVYQADGTGSATIGTDNLAINFSKTYTLAENESISITATSGNSENDSFSLIIAYIYQPTGNEVTIEFQPVASIPYTVNSDTTVNSQAVEVSGDPADGFTVVATNKNYILTGATLVDESGNSSTIAAVGGKLSPTVSGTLTPIFEYDEDGDGIAPFMVGTTDYWNLTAAAAAANSGSNKTVVLKDEYTLPAGDYTIPSGVTLLIPYNDANTLCTTAPTVNDSSLVAPTAYRTLTMASNANIIVNGGLSVAGTQAAAYPINGQVTGPVGVIQMNEGSNITVNSGGSLYAWGYVAGSGAVTIKNGGKVYEDFQVRDYRGGDVTSTLASGTNVSTWHIFPMSQYYVQNVQVPMTLEAGATEFCYFSVTASLMGIKSETINFVGTDSMFQITSGYIVKDYDESNDRLIIDVYGSLEVNPFSIEIQVKGFSSAITINSANYDLPLNSNISINLNGSSIVDLNQDLMLLPGSEINIGESAKLNINNGKRMIVYDDAQWGLYCSDLKKAVVPLAYVYNGTTGAAPAYARTTADLVDAKILVNGTLNAAGGYLYTTEGGGDISSSGVGQVIVQQAPNANAYQIEQKRDGDDGFDSSTELDTHPITSAQLKNSDNTYISSVTHGAGTYTYDSTDGKWHKYGTGVITAPTCTEQGYTTYPCACGGSHVGDYTEATGHIWLEGNCTNDNCDATLGIYSSNISAGDSLDMFFYLEKEKLSRDDYYAVVTKKFADGREDSIATIPYSEWEEVEEYPTLIRFGFADISAKEMNDAINVTVYNADNTAATVLYESSVRTYATKAIAAFSSNTELLTALTDMLNYGAAAQTYFGYDAEKLANAGIDQSNASANDAECTDKHEKGNKDHYGTTVSARNQVILTFYFSNITSDMTAHISYTDHYGNAETLTVEGKDFYARGDLYGVDVTGLAVADGRQLVTCVIKNGDTEVARGVDSIESFVARSADNDVFKMLMKFVDSAYAYFYKENG